jgi:hypothetical protein
MQKGGEGSYFVFRYSNGEEPKPLSLEEATPAIREALITRDSNRAANDAASAALAKLNEAVGAGTAFADAAKELGLEVVSLPNFSENEPPADLPEASLILEAVKGLGSNQISAVTERPGGEGYFLAHVEKIEIYKDDQSETAKNGISASVKNQLDRTLFTAWFNQRRAESGARRPESPLAVQ